MRRGCGFVGDGEETVFGWKEVRRESRTQGSPGEPRSCTTVEKRAMMGVCTPGARRKSAQVRWLTS